MNLIEEQACGCLVALYRQPYRMYPISLLIFNRGISKKVTGISYIHLLAATQYAPAIKKNDGHEITQ